ncbi:Txe/YoeB family addiction module toxin [Pleurocapsa sp. FMAR1]|uniref:Txe/YoeB family addiction module toxin n=1 Tax=Pleurocapsa sp. FMAR1 TaxID=3040204 RepID=UPI0029C94305|nr:Txe/YoeB family addiction module toxin [Pleurocapsa sp. FMAR1]
MKLVFDEQAWEDYQYWIKTDKKILKRINLLIKEIPKEPFDGIGDPELLKYNWSGFWSRRITKEHRLVYAVESNSILIAQCRFHY